MKSFRQSVTVWRDEEGIHVNQTFEERQKRSEAGFGPVIPWLPYPPGYRKQQRVTHLTTAMARAPGYLVYPFALALWGVLAIFWLLGWVIAEAVRAARR